VLAQCVGQKDYVTSERRSSFFASERQFNKYSSQYQAVMVDLWSIASDYGHCRRGFRALASDKTEVSAGHSSGGRLKIENVAGDIRGPEIEKSPASVAVKAAPITCTLEFAWVISTLGGTPASSRLSASARHLSRHLRMSCISRNSI
jgi:hypothetical protein